MLSLLIVDDSRTFSRILKTMLSPHFNIVGIAQDGNEGIAAYESSKPDVVLLDITMPNCSGREALQRIRKTDPKAKIIMISSLGDDATVRECLALGALGFVSKEDIKAQTLYEESPLFKVITSATNTTVAKNAITLPEAS